MAWRTTARACAPRSPGSEARLGPSCLCPSATREPPGPARAHAPRPWLAYLPGEKGQGRGPLFRARPRHCAPTRPGLAGLPGKPPSCPWGIFPQGVEIQREAEDAPGRSEPASGARARSDDERRVHGLCPDVDVPDGPRNAHAPVPSRRLRTSPIRASTTPPHTRSCPCGVPPHSCHIPRARRSPKERLTLHVRLASAPPKNSMRGMAWPVLLRTYPPFSKRGGSLDDETQDRCR